VESSRLVDLPTAAAARTERSLAEAFAAIELVALGVARRVTIQGLADVDAIAAEALAGAQAKGVQFQLCRPSDGGSPLVVVEAQAR
jgi:hypothetical protein